MNQINDVVTPILKPIIQPIQSSEVKLSFQDKASDGSDRNCNSQSLKILGSSLTSPSSTRRNSAFSIYDPNLDSQPSKKDEQSQEPCMSSEPIERHQKRTWKRQKKDKRQLSRLQTKNLNRYFRSKINEMLRDIKQTSKNPQESLKADQVLQMLNKSNKIMFSQIREIIKDSWLQSKLLSCSGVLLKYIHGGKMGMQSKLIMLKYFNKILKAIRNPEGFTCWK